MGSGTRRRRPSAPDDAKRFVFAGVVRATVDSLTALLKFSEADCRGVTRAVDEAMANIVRHSYRGRLDQPIGIRFRRLSGETGPGPEILFWDEGLPIDSSKLRPRRLDEVRPGGLGLHFMRQAMDTVEFSRVGGANRLRMVKFGGGNRPSQLMKE